jgi:hypothetical protein
MIKLSPECLLFATKLLSCDASTKCIYNTFLQKYLRNYTVLINFVIRGSTLKLCDTENNE